MKQIKITPRISEDMHEKIKHISKETDKNFSETIRYLIEIGITNFSKKVKDPSYEKTGKMSLMRAERESLVCSFMTNLILRESIPSEKINEYKVRAKNIVDARWDYNDEPENKE